MKTLTKKKYLQGFVVVTLLLALVRLVFPGVAKPVNTVPAVEAADSLATEPESTTTTSALPSHGSKPHRIWSVPSYKEAFPDTNAVQLVAAQKWGVSPVRNRADAEERKKELVYMASSPYYHVDPLRQSIPYLVPRAAVLLQDIGQAFFDSLYIKGVPLHRLIVTSVLRTQEDVARLRNFNGNATENSCHLYGTTFDICYNRYETVEPPEGPRRRQVRNDTLKYVLSEVLRDMRQQGRCYIKYEVKQGCFHMTVR
ncbi:MAG: hypothetical protein IJ551_03905 [Prevotella sp.]|nr:hypothetical protein [Prevotella sp.]